MKIVVTIKQVPEAHKVAVNPKTGTLIREGVESILNPFCEYALDTAVKLKNDNPHLEVEIIAVSMGPPQARKALMRCLELGVDKAYLLSDIAFAGSDVWATSLTLKEAILKKIGNFDLILAGKQAIDGDTAQVPAELAELLGIPHVYYGFNLKIDKKRIRVKRETDKGYQVIEVRLPALVTISKGPSAIRRFPSMKDMIEARKKPLNIIDAKYLNMDENEIGLNGSLTQVVKIFSPPTKEAGEIIDGYDSISAAKKLFMFLKDKKIV
ncbi:MAG: electron transfer flavoprotein subunit beta/FixA family protein [Promethearchaeota archaeon]|jgi:electron transfer flavoprotein beta subunit